MPIVVDGGTLELSPATPPPAAPELRPATGPVAPVHFALPFRYVNGAPVVNDQDSVDDVAACVEAIVRFPKGYRPEQPDFGITDPTFTQGGANVDLLHQEVAEWEERVDLAMERDPSLMSELVDRVRVTVGAPDAG